MNKVLLRGFVRREAMLRLRVKKTYDLLVKAQNERQCSCGINSEKHEVALRASQIFEKLLEECNYFELRN